MDLSNKHHIEHYAEPPQPRDKKHPTVLQQAGQSMRAQPAYSMYSVLSILVQLTNSGRPKYVSLHQGPKDDFTPRLHPDLINGSAINILNDLNNSPAVEAINPIREVDTIIRNTSANHTKITHTMNVGATLVAPYAAPT